MKQNFIKSFGIVKNQNICIINMPVSNRKELEILPKGVTVTSRPVEKFDKVIFFTNTKDEINRAWDRLSATVNNDGEFWVTIPDSNNNMYNEIDAPFLTELFVSKNVTSVKSITVLSGWNSIKIIKNDQK